MVISPSQHPVSPSLLTGARVRSRKGLSTVHSLLCCGSNRGMSPTLFWSQIRNRTPHKINLILFQTNPYALCTGALMRDQALVQHQPTDALAGLVTFCPITCPQLHGEAGNRADTRARTAWSCLMLESRASTPSPLLWQTSTMEVDQAVRQSDEMQICCHAGMWLHPGTKEHREKRVQCQSSNPVLCMGAPSPCRSLGRKD